MSFLRNRLPVFTSAAAGLLLLAVIPVFAVDWLSLELGQIEGPDWRAESVTVSVDWQATADAAFRLSAKNLIHPALPSPVAQLVIDCRAGVISDQEIQCRDGMLQLQHPALDQPDIPLSFDLQLEAQTLHLELRQIHLAEGGMSIQLHSAAEGWQLQAKGQGLDTAKLLELLQDYLPVDERMELAARSDFSLSLSGKGEEISAVRYQADIAGGAFSDASGEYLADGLVSQLSGGLQLTDGLWRGDARVTVSEGAVLTPFLYLEPTDAPLSIKTQLAFDPGQQRLELSSLEYGHPGVLELGLAVQLTMGDVPQVERLDLSTKPFDVHALYSAYIQPTQAENLLARLEWSGQASLKIDYAIDGPQRLALELKELHVDEVLPPPIEGEEGLAQRRSLGLYGVNGSLVWTQGREAEVSQLAWEGGHLLESISLGPTEMALQLEGQQARLLKPAEVPLLDGSLALQRLVVSQGEQGPHIELNGALTPISMETFSEAMGWPTLAGTLSGGITGASYENGTLTVGGSIVTNVFEGWVSVRNLRMEDMLGVWPLLYADLEFRDLDLQTLTSAFSFGKITGKLEGRIDELYLENWRPVSFDASFATPESDASRHRISQRAVDNISNLGGSGISGALSRSFLRFFEEFGYDRLGISCRLQKGVCDMGGVGPAKQGYYLVKGGGIPRIDIVGFNRRIDWELLVQKLEEITESGTPVIQ